VAAVVEGKLFCVHGGLSPDMTTFEDIEKIPRPVNVPPDGLLCDLLWSDPDEECVGWAENTSRGVSYTFGIKTVEEFNSKHNIDLIVRAHQVVEDGYEFFGSRKLVTVFSAPNYCEQFDNAGAMLNVDENLQCGFSILPAKKLNATEKSKDKSPDMEHKPVEPEKKQEKFMDDAKPISKALEIVKKSKGSIGSPPISSVWPNEVALEEEEEVDPYDFLRNIDPPPKQSPKEKKKEKWKVFTFPRNRSSTN